jgi:hypothetical protein
VVRLCGRLYRSSEWFARLSDGRLGVMSIWELLLVCLRFFVGCARINTRYPDHLYTDRARMYPSHASLRTSVYTTFRVYIPGHRSRYSLNVDADVAKRSVHPPYRPLFELRVQAGERCERRAAPPGHDFLHSNLLVLREKVDSLFTR